MIETGSIQCSQSIGNNSSKLSVGRSNRLGVTTQTIELSNGLALKHSALLVENKRKLTLFIRKAVTPRVTLGAV